MDYVTVELNSDWLISRCWFSVYPIRVKVGGGKEEVSKTVLLEARCGWYFWLPSWVVWPVEVGQLWSRADFSFCVKATWACHCTSGSGRGTCGDRSEEALLREARGTECSREASWLLFLVRWRSFGVGISCTCMDYMTLHCRYLSFWSVIPVYDHWRF